MLFWKYITAFLVWNITVLHTMMPVMQNLDDCAAYLSVTLNNYKIMICSRYLYRSLTWVYWIIKKINSGAKCHHELGSLHKKHAFWLLWWDLIYLGNITVHFKLTQQWCLIPNRRHAIFWTRGDLIHWQIIASLVHNASKYVYHAFIYCHRKWGLLWWMERKQCHQSITIIQMTGMRRRR